MRCFPVFPMAAEWGANTTEKLAPLGRTQVAPISRPFTLDRGEVERMRAPSRKAHALYAPFTGGVEETASVAALRQVIDTEPARRAPSSAAVAAARSQAVLSGRSADRSAVSTAFIVSVR